MMPSTRRNPVAGMLPRRKRLSSDDDQHSSKLIPNPQLDRSLLTRGKNVLGSDVGDPSIDKAAPSSSQMAMVSADEPSRRSCRQRMVSKRLQDMELNYGTRKTQGKRELEGDRIESMPKKKTKLCVKRSSEDMVQLVESSIRTKVANKVKHSSVTSSLHSMELVVELAEETPLIPEALDAYQPLDTTQTLEIQPLETSLPLAIAGSLGTQHREIAQPPEASRPLETVQTVDTENQSPAFQAPVHDDVMSHDEQTIVMANNALTDQAHTQYIIVNNRLCTQVSPITVVQQPELAKCGDESVVVGITQSQDGEGELKSEDEQSSVEGKQTEESTSIGNAVELPSESTVPDPESTKVVEGAEEVLRVKFREEDVPLLDSSADHSENNAVVDEAASASNCPGIIVCADTPELDPEEHTESEQAVETGTELLVSESSPNMGSYDGVVQKAVGDPEKLEKVPYNTAHATQFVMLDDGRQMLLSNADALATAADAVASLSQSMKDVAFIISQDGTEISSAGIVGPAVVGVPEGEAATSLRELVSATRAHQKIKFVTINATAATDSAAAADSMAEKSVPYAPHPCNIDMVINADGQLAAGPATVLSQDGFYRCSMCAYKTDKKANWYKHRYTHMSHRRYVCDQCDHKATTSSNLKRHRLIHSDTKVFKCDQCEAEFRQKIHLLRHINYRHIKKMIKCKHCDYVCANVKPDLEIHMKRRHPSLDEFQFQCDKCGFNAASFRDLKQHQKFHRRGPELKLYCEQCSFVTDCESRLRRHLLVHNKMRPYWCSLCSYKASQKEHVLRHLRTKHKMEPGSPLVETVEEHDGEIVALMAMAGVDMEQGKVGEVGEEAPTAATGQTWMVLEAKDGIQQVVCVSGGDNPGTMEQQMEGGIITDSATTTTHVTEITPSVDEDLEETDEQEEEETGEEEAGEEEVREEEEETGVEQPDVVEKPLVESAADSSDQVELNSPLGSEMAPETDPSLPPDSTSLVDEPEEAVTDNTGETTGSTNSVTFQQRQQLRSLVKDNIHHSSSIHILSKRLLESPNLSQVDNTGPKIMQRKKYKPADFSTREKVFSCIHCTMKFAKLINLYKHLAIQHKDMHATKADGLHTCVWCEYQTNKWKNLLVHMRKHNFREEYGMVSTRYACVVCTYSSQHRKALYAHMMKKHKIQIYVKPDGSASCVIDDTIPGTMSTTDGSAVVLQRPRTDPAPETNSLPAIVSATAPTQLQQVVVATSGVEEVSSGCNSQPTHVVQQQPGGGTQMVMVELEPGMPATAVEIMTPAHDHPLGDAVDHRPMEDMVDHEAADAIEGLQALAEQVMAAHQQQEMDAQSAVKGAQVESVGNVNSGVQLKGSGGGQEEGVAQTQFHVQDYSGQVVMEDSNIQLTQDQLMQLSSGDFIEINGEVYKVEVAEEPSVS